MIGSELPAGFTLDEAPSGQELPAGFSVDTAQPATPEQPQQQVNPFWASKAGRFLQGAAEPVVGLGQLAAHGTGLGTQTMDELARKEHEFYQASRAQAGLTKDDWDYWSGAGNVLSPINAIPGGAAARVAGLGAKTLLGAAGRGAASGAAYAAAQPVADVTPEQGYWGQKAGQAATGALAGAALGPGAQLVGRAIKPTIDAAAQKLVGEGVPLTVGQLAGPSFKRLEDVAAKTPFFGASVREAQERALEGFNTASANRALAPIGEKVQSGIKPGHDLFNYTEGKLSDAYDETHANMSARLDTKFMTDVNNALETAKPEMSSDKLGQLQSIIDKHIRDRFVANKGNVDGSQIQDISSELKRIMRNYRFDASADNRALARSVDDVHDAFENLLMRQNPEQAPVLNKINLGWAHLLRLERATGSSASGAREGAFTPTRLLQADTQLAGRRGAARGQGLYQDIAEAGKQVMPSTVADSGTPERLMTHGAVAGIASGHLNPLSILPGIALPLLYSQTGQKLARAALLNRPAGAEYVSNILRQYGPAATPLPYAQLSGNQ